jgi:hypothetical protein
MGLTKHEAEKHAQHLEQGNTVIVVKAADRRDEAHHIMLKHGAYDDSMTSV